MSDNLTKSDSSRKAALNHPSRFHRATDFSVEGYGSDGCELENDSPYIGNSLGASSSHRHRRGSRFYPLSPQVGTASATTKTGRILSPLMIASNPRGTCKIVRDRNLINKANACNKWTTVNRRSEKTLIQKNQYRRGNKLNSRSSVFCVSSGFLKFSALQCRGFSCGEV